MAAWVSSRKTAGTDSGIGCQRRRTCKREQHCGISDFLEHEMKKPIEWIGGISLSSLILSSRWIVKLALLMSLALAPALEAADNAGNMQRSISEQKVVGTQKQAAVALAMPASQHELWQRLLKLLAEDGGYTPKDRVEAVLGIRFAETRKETNPPTLGAANFYLLKTETEGLGQLQVALFDDPEKTDLGISWSAGRHCLSFRDATEDLHRLGWASGERAVQPWSGGQLDFYLPEEAAYARTHPSTRNPSNPQGISGLYLRSSSHQQSDCLNKFGTAIWRTPLHKQPVE